MYDIFLEKHFIASAKKLEIRIADRKIRTLEIDRDDLY